MKTHALIAARRAAMPLRDALRRAGILGRLDNVLARMSRRFVPPLEEETSASMPGGAKLLIPAGIASGRELLDGSFEREVTRALTESLHPGATFVDVGASIGYHTVLGACIVGESGHVYAFEPDPEAFAYLSRNVRDNAFTHVTMCEMAVADAAGVAELRRAPLEFSSIVLDMPTKDTVDVGVVSLDGFFEDLGWPPVHAVKLDVEGAEHDVVLGMRRLAERNPGLVLIVEWNPVAIEGAGRTDAELAKTLVSVGFSRGRVLEQRRDIDLSRELPPQGALYNVLLVAGLR